MTPAQPPVSVVTGGSSGIGRALAIALAGRGDHVVVVGRNADRLAQTCADMDTAGGAGRHESLALDITQETSCAALRDYLAHTFGRADVLIASAGIGATGASGSRLPPPTRDMALDEWNAVLGVNLHGVFLSNRAVIPLMQQQGSGAIINIGSSTTPHGLRGRPMAPAYCASKFAMGAYTRALADELADDGIHVSAVYPGSVETPLIENTMLDGPFGGSMAQESFAQAVLGLLDFAPEISLPDPHLIPMPRRRGRASKGKT